MKTSLALDYPAILANSARPVHLAATFEADQTSPNRTQPVAFVVVLDKSGSMAGAPLTAAKRAAQAVLRNLRPGDRFGLVAFDNESRIVIPFSSERDLTRSLLAVQEIQPGFTTNMMGGWSLAWDMLRDAPAKSARKILLLTDGLANVGITEPAQITHLVGQALEKDQIRTSCLGFGDCYSEDILRDLAKITGGEFHDANQSDRLPEIFEIELEGLQRIAVQNLRLRVTPANSVENFRLLGFYAPPRVDGNVSEFMIGDLVSAEKRVVTFEVSLRPIPLLDTDEPAATWEGEKLLDLEVCGDIITPDGVELRRETHVVRIKPVQDPKDVSFNIEVISWVTLQAATAIVDQALHLRDEGRTEDARRLLETELRRYANLPQGDILDDARNLVEQALATMRDDENYARSRKMLYHMNIQHSKASSHESTVADADQIPSFKRRRRRPDADPRQPDLRPTDPSEEQS